MGREALVLLIGMQAIAAFISILTGFGMKLGAKERVVNWLIIALITGCITLPLLWK